MGNLFNLAELQLRREGKEVTELAVIDYAVKIRKWLDRNPKSSGDILSGLEVRQYGKRICRVASVSNFTRARSYQLPAGGI